MPPTTLIVLARRIAGAYALDPALVCAVIEQESSWNPYAMRYEPAFFGRYVAPLYTNNKITASEAWARGFSWGLMQVMGQVAREHGFLSSEHPFLCELCDPEQGINVGCRVLSAKLALAANDFPRNAPRPAFVGQASRPVPLQPVPEDARSATSPAPELLNRALLLWNGGGNPSYPAQVLARLPRYA
jgi:soluble lytic murein transglycosylase-like protein